jgi:hypothetical protein
MMYRRIMVLILFTAPPLPAHSQSASDCSQLVKWCDEKPGTVGCINALMCLIKGWKLTAEQSAKPYWYCMANMAAKMPSDTHVALNGVDLAYIAQECTKVKVIPKQ